MTLAYVQDNSRTSEQIESKFACIQHWCRVKSNFQGLSGAKLVKFDHV